MGRLGRGEEALAEAREVCALRERVLGPDHPDTLVSRGDEAHCLERLGRREEAAGTAETAGTSETTETAETAGRRTRPS